MSDEAPDRTAPAGEVTEPGVGVTAGSLADGSVVVLEDGRLVGILTERDLLAAVAAGSGLEEATVGEHMTREVVTADGDWEVYEAAAEMTDHHIRHLVVTADGDVVGVLSIRDLLLAGQRVELTDGAWVVLRDPLTFSVRERRRLQKRLLDLEAGRLAEADVDGVVAVMVGSWSRDAPRPTDPEDLAGLSDRDRELLRSAVRDELPNLQRAVQPAPGWRHWR